MKKSAPDSIKKDYYKNIKKSSQPGSHILLEGEIPADILSTAHANAVKAAHASIEVPGFRVGKAPEHIARQHMNEAALLDRAAEDVLREEYPHFIEHHQIKPIDHPRIQITMLALGNPLGFKITIPVMPDIKLPDYKTIAKSENKNKKSLSPVTDKDIDTSIEEIRKSYAHDEHHRLNPNDTEHTHGELPLPEVTDEFVKKLGDFKDVKDFREKLSSGIAQERERQHKEKHRIATIESIIKAFSIDLPSILVESELDRMMQELSERITGAGMKVSDYFAHINKKEADLRAEWKTEAEKRVKTDIILLEIARAESLKPEEKLVDEQTKQLLTMYKDADPAKTRSYVEHLLTNDKVLTFLETL